MPQVDVLILPYSSADGRSLTQLLIEEFQRPDWSHFTAAVAFVNSSGNRKELVDAIVAFADRGATVDITFGADSLGGEQTSEYQAVYDLLGALDGKPSARIYLYRERGRTFHPKVYLFYNETRAFLIVGSCNWSNGGHFANIEASTTIRLDLVDREDAALFQKVLGYFVSYWRPV